MKKEKLRVNVWFDKSIHLYGASFNDSKGTPVTEVEYAPTKTLALKWLRDNAPEEIIKLTVNNQDRYSASDR